MIRWRYRNRQARREATAGKDVFKITNPAMQDPQNMKKTALLDK
jgi:hypothetical protein